MISNSLGSSWVGAGQGVGEFDFHCAALGETFVQHLSIPVDIASNRFRAVVMLPQYLPARDSLKIPPRLFGEVPTRLLDRQPLAGRALVALELDGEPA